MHLLNDQFKEIRRRVSTAEFLFAFLAVWTLFVLLSTLNLGDLSGYDDAVYAHEAKTILQTGDWWTLSLNGARDFDKPPLFVWLLAASFKVFGATDFAAKLPCALLGWATVITTYFSAKEVFADGKDSTQESWLPALSMFAMATTQYFLKYSTHAMTDVPFTFFFTAAIYFYARSLRNKKFLIACGAAIGLATLTRTPIGLFPLGIIVLHALFTKRFNLIFSFYFAACVALAFLIPAIWFFKEYALFGDYFFTAHFANFLAHSNAPVERSGGQKFLWHFEYLFLLARLYEPWFAFALGGFFLAARGVFKTGEKASPEIFLIVWVAVVLILFSQAEAKVLRYILPAFPAFAMLSALALQKVFPAKLLPKLAPIAVALLTAAAIISAARPNYVERGADMRALAPVADAATEKGEKVWLYASGDVQWGFRNQLIWYGNRLCEFTQDLREIETLAREKKRAVVIMDKPSFADLQPRIESNDIEILGESENFVCFRT